MYVKGIGKVKQNPIYFYNKDANGNYIKTNAEDFKKNLEARLDYDSADSADFVKKLNRLYNSMSDEAASQSTSSSAAVIAVKLTNDKLCTRRYQKYNVDASGNPTSLVTYVDTYDGKTRAVETGDVYVDSSTGRMYVYCSPTGFGTGWFCMGYYPGYDYLSGTVSYPS
jgi:hypothetical protein